MGIKNQLKAGKGEDATASHVSISSATAAGFNPSANKARLGQKLTYEWKNIFRGLRQQETFPKGQGYVTKDTLEQVLLDNNVRLTRHEFKMLSNLYKEELQGGSAVINYLKMSKDLSLHSNKLSMIQPSLAGPD